MELSRYEMEKVNYIQKNLSQPELLAQLAEEASELAHAALKYRRALSGENPTPVSCSEARENLLEELVDVRIAAEVARCYCSWRNETVWRLGRQKLDRWVERLRQA